MTKEELKKELLEKVKAGIKPSTLKKLKRSKSADDISQIPDPPPLPNPPTHLLQDQLAEKQKLIEALRKQLEEKKAELTQTKQELDNSLFSRIAAVQQFGQVYDKLQQVKKELDATVDEASDELITSDNQVSQLRTKLRTASQEISNLQKELKNQRIKRGNSSNNFTPADDFPNLNYLKYTLYALIAI